MQIRHNPKPYRHQQADDQHDSPYDRVAEVCRDGDYERYHASHCEAS